MKRVTRGQDRRRLTLLTAIVTVGLFSGTGAAEANHSIDVNFTTDSHTFYPGPLSSNEHAFGHVIDDGPRPCLVGRTLKLFKGTAPAVHIDSGRSSSNGFWGLGGNLSGATYVEIRMSRKKFGPRRNRHICQADTNGFSI